MCITVLAVFFFSEVTPYSESVRIIDTGWPAKIAESPVIFYLPGTSQKNDKVNFLNWKNWHAGKNWQSGTHEANW